MRELNYGNIVNCSDELFEKSNFMIIGGDNQIIISKNVRAALLNIKIEGNLNTIIIEDNVIIKESLYINITDNSIRVTIGERTTFENNYITVADDNNFVEIGKDCMFALGSGIVASDFHSILDKNSGKRINASTGVVLGDHVWIGMNAIILKNCMVANNSIIGACSLVTKDVPNNVIVSGNPAKIIKEYIEWTRERIGTDTNLVYNDFSYVKPSNLIQFNVEALQKDRIQGWAFIENMESYKTEIYIEIELTDGSTKCYKAKINARGDVSEAFKNEKYLFSGFDCVAQFSKKTKLIMKNGSFIGYKNI